MLKYDFKFKKKVVLDYLACNGGYGTIAKRYGIHDSSVCRWVMYYTKYGDEGLKKSRQNKKFSFQKKLSIVNFYISNEISYQDLAFKEGINNASLIYQWVNNYRKYGPEGLRPKRGQMPMKKQNIEINNSEVVDTSVEHVKQLEEELKFLRIENAYLKELRRLRLEDEAKVRERLLSSAASEENSN